MAYKYEQKINDAFFRANREDIHTDLECVIDTLSHIRHNSEFEKVDVLIINKAIELIDSVAWKYEEDE